MPLEKVREFLLSFAAEMEEEHADVMADIQESGNLSAPAIETIRAALEESKRRVSGTWQV